MKYKIVFRIVCKLFAKKLNNRKNIVHTKQCKLIQFKFKEENNES